MELDRFESDLQTFFPDTCTRTGNILVLTGERGAGKSAYLQGLIESYRQSSRTVAGLLTLGRFENGTKTGYIVTDLATGEARLLAHKLLPGSSLSEAKGMQFGHWEFDPEVFAWGNQRLEQFTGADILAVDELGFLEFDLKAGWMASFEALRKQEYRLALVVIRPECIEPFSRLGFAFQVKEIVHG